MKEKDLRYSSSNGESEIAAKLWLPDSDGNIGALVQICHGMSEHIERYKNFVEYLVNKGFAVCANDHAGHGASARELYGYMGESNGHLHMVADVRTLHEMMREEYPGKPYFLFGHSMGSFIARFYTEQYGDELDGVIYSGSGDKFPCFQLMLLISELLVKAKGAQTPGKFFAKYQVRLFNRRVKNPRTAADWLSRDEAAVDAFLADSLCGFPFTYGGYRDLFMLMDYISRADWAENIRKDLPIYFFSGDEDPVGNYSKGVRKVYEKLLRAGCKDVSLKIYEGGRHEMLNESNRLEVYEDIYNWLVK